MYVKSLKIRNFKCFRESRILFQYPGRRSNEVQLKNVNLILGDNGGGKSSVLRALAIACLAPALTESGFVPYRLVRRVGDPKTYSDAAEFAVDALLTHEERLRAELKSRRATLYAKIERRDQSNLDRIVPSEDRQIQSLLSREYSDDFFVIGYGATRRLETGDYAESSHRRSRGLRYARIASLFEDHVALRPLEYWGYKLQRRDPERYRTAVDKLNQVLPDRLFFTGQYDADDSSALFIFDGNLIPLTSLSDGYKAFIGWAGDLIGHISDIAEGKHIDAVSGLVLIDEIDLHLHPEWQRIVVPAIANAFPKLQFVFTTHSPLIASTVSKENIFVTGSDEDGAAIVRQLDEHAFGRSVEQLLLSSYFGLESTRPAGFVTVAEDLFKRAAGGDADAALKYLDELTDGIPDEGSDIFND